MCLVVAGYPNFRKCFDRDVEYWKRGSPVETEKITRSTKLTKRMASETSGFIKRRFSRVILFLKFYFFRKSIYLEQNTPMSFNTETMGNSR